MFELFSILQLFKKWREKAGGFSIKGTRQSYEDLWRLAFGMVCVACSYLDTDKLRWMNKKEDNQIHHVNIFCKNTPS